MSDILVNIIESKKADEGASISFFLSPLGRRIYIFSTKLIPRFLQTFIVLLAAICFILLLFLVIVEGKGERCLRSTFFERLN